ncbi:MAG: iron ABC transporter permease [Thermoanaerobaculales bacterium]|nr:iron ABC transporter permease [Thermoanaerobaculales bacterium]
MKTRFALLLVMSVGVVLLAPFVGMVDLTWEALTDIWGNEPEGMILWRLRVPRVLVAFVAGMGLALGGAAFQALFRNPLATPYTLGVASGAALGVAVATRFSVALAMLGGALLSVSALAGALAAVGVVWVVARIRPDFSTTVLLLAGVAMTFFFSSLILFLQYTATLGDSFRLVRWLMGGLGAARWESLGAMTLFVVVGGVVVARKARDLDLFMVGSEIAASRGVDVSRTQRDLFLGTSLMVGGVVATCGPIGFVGMMAPHIARLLVGSGHRVLLPVSAVFGGAFLVICDTLARSVIAPVELPVGVITAFLGGPFFLWLLVRRTEGR